MFTVQRSLKTNLRSMIQLAHLQLMVCAELAVRSGRLVCFERWLILWRRCSLLADPNFGSIGNCCLGGRYNDHYILAVKHTIGLRVSPEEEAGSDRPEHGLVSGYPDFANNKTDDR